MVQMGLYEYSPIPVGAYYNHILYLSPSRDASCSKAEAILHCEASETFSDSNLLNVVPNKLQKNNNC